MAPLECTLSTRCLCGGVRVADSSTAMCIACHMGEVLDIKECSEVRRKMSIMASNERRRKQPNENISVK